MSWLDPIDYKCLFSVFGCVEYQCRELIRWPDAWQHCGHCHIGGAGISYKHCKHHNNHLPTMRCEAMTMLWPWGQYLTITGRTCWWWWCSESILAMQDASPVMQIWWMWPLTMLMMLTMASQLFTMRYTIPNQSRASVTTPPLTDHCTMYIQADINRASSQEAFSSVHDTPRCLPWPKTEWDMCLRVSRPFSTWTDVKAQNSKSIDYVFLTKLLIFAAQINVRWTLKVFHCALVTPNVWWWWCDHIEVLWCHDCESHGLLIETNMTTWDHVTHHTLRLFSCWTNKSWLLVIIRGFTFDKISCWFDRSDEEYNLWGLERFSFQLQKCHPWIWMGLDSEQT